MASAKIIKGEFKWHGPDRRDRRDRRVDDRREEVRYEPAKDDRRDGTDRRQDGRDTDGYRRSKQPGSENDPHSE